jgi:type I restriction enzyme, R subunit
MPLGEADTRAKLIDPALHARGWTEDLIRREETAGAVNVVDGRPRRRGRGRTDYTLRVKVSAESQPVAVALIEAKAEHLPPGHGLDRRGAPERVATAGIHRRALKEGFQSSVYGA